MKRALMLTLAVALLAACAPAYKKLPALSDVPELERLARQSEARRQETWTLEVGVAGDEPYSIVAEETGSGRDDELVVLIHGLAGNEDSSYMRQSASHFSDAGYRVLTGAPLAGTNAVPTSIPAGDASILHQAATAVVPAP